MEIEEAVSIIEEMIQSLKNNPNQFHINVNVTGQQITSQGGTGLIITATGGGPGSTTIGEIVSASGGGCSDFTRTREASDRCAIQCSASNAR